MSGWKECGERLREHWRQVALKHIQDSMPPELRRFFANLPEPGLGMTWTATASPQGINLDFWNALRESSEDDMSALATYLESDKPLGPIERERLARILPRPRKMGRPQNTQLRAAAQAATFFYKRWRASNKELGISDHGQCAQMKDISAQWMVEDWFRWADDMTDLEAEEFAAQVRELMEKSKALRDDTDKALVGFPLFGWSKNPQKS